MTGASVPVIVASGPQSDVSCHSPTSSAGGRRVTQSQCCGTSGFSEWPAATRFAPNFFERRGTSVAVGASIEMSAARRTPTKERAVSDFNYDPSQYAADSAQWEQASTGLWDISIDFNHMADQEWIEANYD